MDDQPRKARRRSGARAPVEARASRLHAGRSGEWMEASALRLRAIELFAGSPDAPASDLVLDLEGLDHLDASALQVLLAIAADQRRRGGALQIEHISASLQQWFGYAGAAELPGLAADSKEAAAGEGQGHA